MNSHKCTKCGLVSWVEDGTCKRCGESLLDQVANDVSKPEGSTSWKVPDVVSCSLLGFGAAFVAFNQYLGPLGYPVSMLAFISGLGYSIVRVYRSTQDPQLDRKRDAVTSLVINALLVVVLGASVPIYFLGRNPESRSFEWRDVSAAGEYTIQLPDDPEKFQQLFQTGNGPALTLMGVTANMGKRGQYVSGSFDMFGQRMTASDDWPLDFVCESVASERKGMVMVNRPLRFASPRGLSVTASECNLQLHRDAVSRLRLYWVRERQMVYINMATFQNGTLNEVSAEKFLDSFHFNTR